MIYQFDSRVRYSEVDMQRNLTLGSIINYFQDCSSFHSESIGQGIDRLRERKRAWFLSSWQIVIGRRPRFGEKITIQTWPYGLRMFYGDRNYAMLDEQGRRLVWANSLWAFVDTETGHPVRAEQEDMDAFGSEEKLDMDYAPRKIRLPLGMEVRESFQVRKAQIDTNLHVNNGQYVQMAAEYLPEDFQLAQMRAEYKKSAKLDDVILPQVHTEPGLCTVALCGEDGKPYAVVEFSGAAS